jgi:putative ABC transport system ATP-binding protein
MEPVIVCKKISKVFGTETAKIEALKDIDLEIFPGELFMIEGPSGSGKTTLLSIISGILDADAGDCLILNKSWQAFSEAEKRSFRGTNIGFIFQTFNLIPMFSCAENVSVPLLINGENEKSALLKATELLTNLGLGARVLSPPNERSIGQQQRVAIARGLIHNPQIIVCDEPTSSLDSETGQKVLEILKASVINEKKTVVVVTHDNRIFSYADRIAKLEDGKISIQENHRLHDTP